MYIQYGSAAVSAVWFVLSALRWWDGTGRITHVAVAGMWLVAEVEVLMLRGLI